MFEKLKGKFNCLIGNHDFEMIAWFTRNFQKIHCARCKKNFGINHYVRSVLVWNNELEDLAKISNPEHEYHKRSSLSRKDF